MTPNQIESKIIGYLKSGEQPLKPRRLARRLDVAEEEYTTFREALKDLMRQGRVMLGSGGTVLLPTQKSGSGLIVGVYKQHRRGFGFVIPRDPDSHEDIFIPPGGNGGAITGDIVSAKVVGSEQRDGKTKYDGKIVEVIERKQTRFAGTLAKQHGHWIVLPDGNAFTDPILAPDAAARHIKPGTKVVIEITSYPEEGKWAQGVIAEVLGKAGEKDVDLKSVIVQYNLPSEFPEEVVQQARDAIARFNAGEDFSGREDLSKEVVCTIDPPDAKDYDDAISLRRLPDGRWELGVHIADVSYFVPQGTPLDLEAYERGNSTYFPGHVIPMLPEILSNGVCSLQEGVPRLCKSAFITIGDDARPQATRVANTIIHSARRLRYIEAQAIIDNAEAIPHPDGDKTVDDYPPAVVKLLHDMNQLAKRIQKRRHHDGQLVLELPKIQLTLDEEGKVTGTTKEDESFTHTLIEMFMVEANEAVARLFDSQGLPFMRRTHADPEPDSSTRLRHFVEVAGYRLPKDLDRKALQALLASVHGKPESFAINLAVLKSLARAEYSPESIGHYALASENYCHFTSPIRRYADLLVHRLLDSLIQNRAQHGAGRKKKQELENFVPREQLVEIGRHISFTERRSDDAEKELRQVKVLELMSKRVGEQFLGVVTGITNFGVFIQIGEYLIDGLIRYEELMDDWWDVDERAGRVRGQRTGTTIGIGDSVRVTVVNVDVARRELNLAIAELLNRSGGGRGAPTTPRQPGKMPKGKHERHKDPGRQKHRPRGADAGGARGGGPRGGGPRGGGRRGGGPRAAGGGGRGPKSGGRPKGK